MMIFTIPASHAQQRVAERQSHDPTAIAIGPSRDGDDGRNIPTPIFGFPGIGAPSGSFTISPSRRPPKPLTN
jgi:hypothetical protein